MDAEFFNFFMGLIVYDLSDPNRKKVSLVAEEVSNQKTIIIIVVTLRTWRMIFFSCRRRRATV